MCGYVPEQCNSYWLSVAKGALRAGKNSMNAGNLRTVSVTTFKGNRVVFMRIGPWKRLRARQ